MVDNIHGITAGIILIKSSFKKIAESASRMQNNE